MEDWSPASDALSSTDLELATTPLVSGTSKLRSENSKIKWKKKQQTNKIAGEWVRSFNTYINYPINQSFRQNQ